MNPFPLPPSLLWVRWAIDAFPAIALTLHWLPLVVYRRDPTHDLRLQAPVT